MTIATQAGDVIQADVMRTIIDTVTFTIDRDGADPMQEARETAALHFGPTGVDHETATITDVVANLRRKTRDGNEFRHVEGSFG